MYQLKKIDLLTLAIYSFILYLILSLLFMIPMGMFYTMVNRLMPEMTGQQNTMLFPFFNGIFFIILPIIYSFFGTIMNVIIALIYNLVSIKLGGIKFSVEKVIEIEKNEETKNRDQGRNMF